MDMGTKYIFINKKKTYTLEYKIKARVYTSIQDL